MSILLEPPGISALGKGSLFFLPTIASLSAPKVSEFTAGTNLTCAVDAGWEPTYEESSGSRMKYCSTAEFEVRGKGKWTGSQLVYEWDPQNPDDITNYKHVTALAAGTKGYLALRLGLGKDQAIAAAQKIAWIKPVEFGAQVTVPVDPSNDGQVLQLTQRYFVTGSGVENVTVAT